jgi:serine/threonine-protein phosphatase 2A regulatory subunit B''
MRQRRARQIHAYFSYKHFYVLYCRFWELDTDHDGLITKYGVTRGPPPFWGLACAHFVAVHASRRELAGHDQHALSTRIIDQIARGAGRLDHGSLPLAGGGTLGARVAAGHLTFEDFVWFLLSEEDKTTPTAIEYWFRCLDMDGDGVLSLFELEYFYEEQQARLQSVAMESLALRDTLCQLLDLVKPAAALSVTVADLKRCQLAPVFFDTLFNLAKFVLRETKHPSAIREERNRPKMRYPVLSRPRASPLPTV